MNEPWLFEGKWLNGRLTNEISLIRDCPLEFQTPINPWTDYVLTLFKNGGGMFTNWEWQRFYANERANEAEKSKRQRCFADMFRTSNSSFPPAKRATVLGWMLSEMLVEVPVYKPLRFQYHNH
jgi:hypothetical protein